MLAEKEAVIENYQRQNLQLQMAAAASAQTNAVNDPFALAFGLPSNAPSAVPASTSVGREDLDRLERELNEKNDLISRLQHELQTLRDRESDVIRNAAISPSMTSAGSSQMPSDVIPAPPMFFASEQMTPSPFDEIVQVRSVNSQLESAFMSQESSTLEQPTIEDLQRNVSDLEKHAQDLENKLASRNQREREFEERLRDSQTRLLEFESKTWELEQHKQNALAQVQQLQSQLEATEANLQQLNIQIECLNGQLLQKSQQFDEIQQQLLVQNANKIENEQLQQVQNKVQQLQALLQEKDLDILNLKEALEQEKQLSLAARAIESQIMPSSGYTQAEEKSMQPTLDMFFGSAAAAPEFESLIMPTAASHEPVVEETIVPKKAYVCQPNETEANSATALELGDDDWGDSWGAKEAAAEAAHFANSESARCTSLISREQQLELQLAEQSDRIQELQLQLDRCEQQKQELQVKSGKLMKKLKELKTKNDELANNSQIFRKSSSVESDSMFADLVTNELKQQISTLEQKLQEQQKLQNSHEAEKEKLLKRIDVLTAGNERMSEMKERQDMDVQMYQARIKELQEKLNRLDDWGNEEKSTSLNEQEIVASPKTIAANFAETAQQHADSDNLQHKIDELIKELQDLKGDNQELQALLEEEKSNSQRAEESVKSLQKQLANLNNEAGSLESSEKYKYNELKLQLQNLEEKYLHLETENQKLQQELNVLKNDYELLQKQKLELTNHNEHLMKTLQENELQANEAQSKILQLTTQLEELQTSCKELETVSNNDNDKQMLQDLQAELLNLKRDNEHLVAENQHLQAQSNFSTNKQDSSAADDLAAQLQEKESEIMHLKQRIEDLMREDQTEKLVLEILTKNQEIHLLKMQVKTLEEDKLELEHNLSLQITKEMQAGKTAAATTAEQQNNSELEAKVKELQAKLKELEEEKTQMETELQVLNTHVLNSLEQEDKMKSVILELDAKNIEIAELRKSQQQQSTAAPTNEVSSTSNTANVDFVALNAQWEAIVEERCGEIANMWRQHMAQREAEFAANEQRLQQQLEEALKTAAQTSNEVKASQNTVNLQSAETTATSNTPASESTSVSGSTSATASKDGTPLRSSVARIINTDANELADADAIIQKMQAALESQEMEIVTLKEQLAIRSAEYARLAAQYDPFKLQNTLSHSGMNTVTSGPTNDAQGRRSANASDATLVPKSELDLALYMLHQRDMRCEEMTVELVSLLEERDTLQLKLSNTLRQVEAIKAQTNYVDRK